MTSLNLAEVGGPKSGKMHETSDQNIGGVVNVACFSYINPFNHDNKTSMQISDWILQAVIQCE